MVELRNALTVEGLTARPPDAASPAVAGDDTATVVVDCGGRLVLPGFVCAHTHLYSALARGMPMPSQAPTSFREILERVWWRLDCALDAEAIELSALVGAIEAARAGCTTLVDHHASPGPHGASIDGSLDLVADAVARVGLRIVTGYEVTDRNGAAQARAGLHENERFLARIARDRPPLVRGLIGAHAAFTLTDATAAGLADLAHRHGVGIHIHVAEDAIDARHGEQSTVAWLDGHGLLDARAVVAHAVHVDDGDLARLAATGAWIVHNARSNENNAVGYARPGRFGDRLLLGSDGIDADMRAEAQAAFFGARAHGDGADIVAALARNRAFAATLFEGAGIELPDRVVLDYRSPTPLDAGNFGGHLLFGLRAAAVTDVVVAGVLVVRDGVCVNVDEERIYARAREVADALWRRL